MCGGNAASREHVLVSIRAGDACGSENGRSNDIREGTAQCAEQTAESRCLSRTYTLAAGHTPNPQKDYIYTMKISLFAYKFFQRARQQDQCVHKPRFPLPAAKKKQGPAELVNSVREWA